MAHVRTRPTHHLVTTSDQIKFLTKFDRSSIFFLKVKGLSISITKEGECGGLQLLTKFERTLNTDRQTDRLTNKFPHIYPPKRRLWGYNEIRKTLARYGSGRTERRTDRQRQSNIPMAGDKY
ncbi:hypothetical protein DPMN_137527 [Dreissena polymorpha]|uniref:Uncharacterized protein n=1 Tax=Dreissena polymorpha TaxID=45954 RepID=A0A9D4JDR0_DREPO|nr:hypothetical protein DPMN_137527 [Dreissena polymorpha]